MKYISLHQYLHLHGQFGYILQVYPELGGGDPPAGNNFASPSVAWATSVSASQNLSDVTKQMLIADLVSHMGSQT